MDGAKWRSKEKNARQNMERREGASKSQDDKSYTNDRQRKLHYGRNYIYYLKNKREWKDMKWQYVIERFDGVDKFKMG